MQLIDILIGAGLTKNEAKVYLQSLELGGSSILQIGKAARMSRTIVHQCVQNLIEKGFALEQIEGKRRQILARNPEHIREILRKEQREVRKKELSFEEVLPKLKEKFISQESDCNVITLQGEDGFKEWCKMMSAETEGEILEFCCLNSFPADVQKWVGKNYIEERKKKSIPTRILLTRTKHIERLLKMARLAPKQFPPVHAAFLPDGFSDHLSYIAIWNEKMGVYAFDTQSVIIIQNRSIVEQQKILFEAAWASSAEGFKNFTSSWQEVIENYQEQRAKTNKPFFS